MRRASLVALAILLFSQPSPAVVLDDTRTATFSPTALTTIFSIPFHFIVEGDLIVEKTTESSGVTVTLKRGLDYVVCLPVGSLQGKVKLTAAIEAAHTLTVSRLVPVTQTTAYDTQRIYSAQRHENSFDKLTMILQQVEDGIAGSSTALDGHADDSDPHDQYALLPGRSGGQHLRGGTGASENLQLSSTASDTKGAIALSANGSTRINEPGRLGVAAAPPSAAGVRVGGDLQISDDLVVEDWGCLSCSEDASLPLEAFPLNEDMDFSLSAANITFGSTSLGYSLAQDDFSLFVLDLTTGGTIQALDITASQVISPNLPWQINDTGPTSIPFVQIQDDGGLSVYPEGLELWLRVDEARAGSLYLSSESSTEWSIQPESDLDAAIFSAAEAALDPLDLPARASVFVFPDNYATASLQNHILLTAPGSGVSMDLETTGHGRVVSDLGTYINKPVDESQINVPTQTLDDDDCNSVWVNQTDTVYQLPCLPPEGCQIKIVNEGDSCEVYPQSGHDDHGLGGAFSCTGIIYGTCSDFDSDDELGASPNNGISMSAANAFVSMTFLVTSTPAAPAPVGGWYVTECFGATGTQL